MSKHARSLAVVASFKLGTFNKLGFKLGALG